MEIRNLITFTKVAETQSLSLAAKALGYAQSTVTMQMQQLEQELGTQLYERVGRQIHITQTGQDFLSYASAIVRMSEEAMMVGKQSSSAVTGSLRLGMLSALPGKMISVLTARYLQKYPQVDLNIQTSPDPEAILSDLRHNKVDLALILDLPRTDPDLIHAAKDQPLSLHLYAGKDHPLSAQNNLTQETLSHYPLIRTGLFDHVPDYILTLSASRQIQISDPELALSIVAESSHTGTPASMILAPDLMVQEHPACRNLVRLDYEVPGSGLWLQVLYHRNKWLTGAMKAWLSDSQKLSIFL